MTPKCFVLLLAGLFAFSPVVRAQIQWGGSVDLEYRNGGRDSRPLLNQTPTAHGTLYLPAARLFLGVDLGSRWWLQAALQADYYGRKELSPVFFSLLNVNWQPFDTQALLLRAGRFVLPFGLEPGRYLGFENPFVHLPLLQELHLRVDTEVGYFDGVPSYETFPGQAVVYGRMYTQGLSASGASDPGERFTYAVAATLASASSPLQVGFDPMPAFTGRATFKPALWSRIGLSFTHGPYMHPTPANDGLDDRDRYRQTALSGDLNLNYGYFDVSAQYTWSRWTTFRLDLTGVQGGASPLNAGSLPMLDDDVELGLRHLLLEATADLPFLVGAHAALRYERFRFGDVPSGRGSSYEAAPWTPAYDRVEAALGYRLTRSLRLKGSCATAWNGGPDELDDDVLALQLSVLF